MAVDYRDQYTKRQLEPFWPNEIIKMIVVVLCTLTTIMALVTLPTVLEFTGVTGMVHEEEPANPRVTPPHIKPEWYFLATYQYLKLMEYPQQWLGIDGKMLGVFSQGVLGLAVVLLPFWYRKAANKPPSWLYYFMVTAFVIIFLTLTVAAIWPPSTLFITLMTVTLAVFYLLMWHERRGVRRLMTDEPPAPGAHQ